MAEQITKSKKNVKKKFFDVVIPLTSAKANLYGAEAEEFEGRVVNIDLTKSLRGKNVEYKLRVKNKDGALMGEPISLAVAGSFIRRSIRKGTDYVEDSFVAECRDGKVIIKPFLITRKRVSRAIRKSLRENTRKFLEGHLKARSIEEVMKDIMINKIQKELSLKLKKVYPLAFCEIRHFEVVKEEKKLD